MNTMLMQKKISSTNIKQLIEKPLCCPNVTDISTILNSKISSPISMKRKGSPMYWKKKASKWKEKCFSLQTIITDKHEKSISLNEIPDLLTIQKIKSTQSNGTHKATTRVTQVHSSMEGEDVLKLVEFINNSKEKKVQEKEDREQKRVKKLSCSIDARKDAFQTIAFAKLQS